MKGKKTKRLIVILMTGIMLLGLLPVFNDGSSTVYAAEPDVEQFATKNQLMTEFDLENNSSNIARIKFGVNGTDVREWLIAGEDKTNGTLAMLSTSSFGDSKYDDMYSKYSTSTVKTLLEDYATNTSYFSIGEQGYMEETTVSTLEYDQPINETARAVTGKLYLADAKDRYSIWDTNIYVGTDNDIPIDLKNNLTDANGFQVTSFFWLRSPSYPFSDVALVAWPGDGVNSDCVNFERAVVPAFNLDLSSVIFASAANAASAEGKLTVDDAFTLRYASSDLGSATINSAQTSVTLSDVSSSDSGTYLVVQNSDGAWAKEVSGDTIITPQDINENLTSFENCKVWLESTDADRITTATMANVETGYSVFAYKDELTSEYGLSESSSNIARIKFGVDGTDERKWLIAGEDTENGTLALLSASFFGNSKYNSTLNSKYSESNVKSLLEGYTSTTDYFSNGEQAYMDDTTVSTLEYDQADKDTAKTETGKLYLADAENRNSWGASTIYVGTNNNIPISLGNLTSANGFSASDFWLRSPYSSNYSYALVAWPGYFVNYNYVNYPCAVVPAFNLNLESVIFASAANAASSEGELTVDNAFTLRYESSDLGSAAINSAQTSVTVSDAPSGTYLVVQNGSGAWAIEVDASTSSISASEISNGSLTSFASCKVWLESTDTTERITTATMAKNQYSVQISAGSHMTKKSDSGEEEQTVTSGSSITKVVYEAEDGYYFPEDYSVGENGITVTRDSATQITVSGTPEANTQIALDAATEKEIQSAPSVSGGVEKITDTTTAMEYANSPDATNWTDCVNDETVVAAGTWYVRYKETDTKNASLTTEVEVREPTYTITASPDDIDFGTKNEGYTQPDAKTVTIKNTGNSTVTLIQPSGANYEIGTLSTTALATGETATFTVQPKADLAAGDYNGTITVSTDKGTSVEVKVSFTVNEEFKVTIDPDNATIIEGQSQTLKANPEGGSGSYTYQWYAGSETPEFSADQEVSVSPTATTTYKVVVNDGIEDIEATVTVTVNPATYTITASPDDIDFGTKNEGYTQPDAKTVTIKNTGNSTVTLIQPSGANYEIGTLSTTALASGDEATFMVQPGADLAAGDYNETITVNTNKETSVEVKVSFTVNEEFKVTIDPDNATIIEGQSQTLKANPEGGSGSYTYQWYAGSETPEFSNDQEVSVSPTATTTYKVVVNDGIENIEATVTVEVTPVHRVELVSTDTHMSPSVEVKEVQNVTDGEPMEEVVYTADADYYFPEDYTVAGENGITVTRNSYRQITVSGTPTDDVTLTLIPATEKEEQGEPDVAGGIAVITGTDTTMQYTASVEEDLWDDCDAVATEVEAGTWYVRYKETDTKKAGAVQEVAVIAKSYQIRADKEEVSFADRTEGYESVPEAQTVTITNEGNQEITLKQPVAEDYDVGTLTATTLAPDETATFTIRPKTGLAAGTYEESITVSTEEDAGISIKASFTVNEALSVNINGKTKIYAGDSNELTAEVNGGTGDYSFYWESEGEEVGTAQAVTVTPTADTTYTVTVTDEGDGKKTVNINVTVIAVELTSISVNKKPDITNYIVGETLDPTGLELTLTYNNGNKETVVYNAETEAWFSFIPSLLTGLTTEHTSVEISYGGITVTQDITVLEQVAAVTADPLSGTYPAAQQVTLTSKTNGATIYYTTDGSEPTTESTLYRDTIEVANTQTIRAMAVKEGMADSRVSTFAYIIKQDTTAEKLVYDLSAVTYNKTARELTVTAKEGEDLGTITVKYNGSAIPPVNAGVYAITVDISESASFNRATDIALGTWEILPKTLTNVSVVIPDVKQDSTLTLTDQTLELISEAIEDGDSVSGICQVTLGSTTETGSYQDASVEVEGVNNPNYTFTGTLTEQSYTVVEKILTGIEITSQPEKDTYFAGEVFDKTGMEVTAYYDSGDPVILENDAYSISPSGGLTSSDDTITVSYGGKTDTVSISVKLVELTAIVIEKGPDKTEYVEGQSFSDIGMVVKAQYNNGAEQVISGYSFSPKDALTTVGTQDITLSYTEGEITKEAIQQVEVIARAVSSIEVISQPFQRSYVEGQSLSLSGLVVTLTYNDGTSQEVDIEDFADFGITTSIDDGTELSLSEHNGQTITITYEGISAETESLTVSAKAVTGLKIKNPPEKLSYTAGDALDLSGLTVTLIYNNGDTADVAYTDFEASGITVNYKDGDILTSSANGASILVTYNEISVSAGELAVTPQLYQITVGAGSTFEIGTTTPILIICSGALNDLTGVYVDGILLDPANYTVTSGSTILTLNPDYLNSLAVGTHSLRLEYLYGSAETTFKVAEAKQTADTTKTTTTPAGKTIAKTGTSAKTGDTASVMLWIALVVLSGIVISGSMWYRRKRR